MVALEEAKMQTAGFKPGSGAAFYGLGKFIHPWFKPGAVPGIGKNLKGLDPLFQKTVGTGVIGSLSGEFAGIVEAAWEDITGEADFATEFKNLYSDMDEVESRILTNALVFGVVGQFNKGGRFNRRDLAVTKAQKLSLLETI